MVLDSNDFLRWSLMGYLKDRRFISLKYNKECALYEKNVTIFIFEKNQRNETTQPSKYDQINRWTQYFL